MAGVPDFETSNQAVEFPASSTIRGAGTAKLHILKRISGASWGYGGMR